MQENKLYTIAQEDDKTVVSLYPSNMNELLENKLCPQDIITGISCVNKSILLSSLRNDLSNGCCEIDCPYRKSCDKTTNSVFGRALPCGKENAKIMFVNNMPTLYETLIPLSHCDQASVLLSLILDKIHVSRDDVYFTDIIKCCRSQVIAEAVNLCVTNYLSKEIMMVDPEIIVFSGQNGIKSLIKLGYITGLTTEIIYGNIYIVNIFGLTKKVMAMYDLDKVLRQEGEKYKEYKTAVWKQILTAFKSITSP